MLPSALKEQGAHPLPLPVESFRRSAAPVRLLQRASALLLNVDGVRASGRGEEQTLNLLLHCSLQDVAVDGLVVERRLEVSGTVEVASSAVVSGEMPHVRHLEQGAPCGGGLLR